MPNVGSSSAASTNEKRKGERGELYGCQDGAIPDGWRVLPNAGAEHGDGDSLDPCHDCRYSDQLMTESHHHRAAETKHSI